MAPRYPSIPEPTLEPTSLRDSILSIKQMLEILTGQRGNADYAAVMPGEFNNSIDSVNSTKVSKSGDTMTGPLLALSKANNLGEASGAAANTAVNWYDANILLYNYSPVNWSGIGTDGNGHMWFKVGTSGSPPPQMWLNAVDGSFNLTLNANIRGDVKVGEAGGSNDHLSVVNQRAEHTSLGLYQLGYGQWSWGMITGDGTMRLRYNGLTGTDYLTVSTAGDLQWAGGSWTDYTPTVNITGGAGTATGRYKKLGKTVALKLVLTVTTTGTVPLVSLPFPAAGSGQYFLVGRENLVTGYTHIAIAQGANAFVIRYDNVSAVTAGWQIHLSGVYEAA